MANMKQSKLKEAIKVLTTELHTMIAETIVKLPERTYRQIAEDFSVSEATVLLAASKHGLSRAPGPKPKGTAAGPADNAIEEESNAR